ncbi:copper chaperone PCu(A)C [Corynebacterium capitovis]|uniref:copper chaperone PCu(A)C n=1 Tax=Corynebacterium capitovis TaxID=131081 RepID=UPI0003733222|nr:copper chaperone PCu(A)C [Corynebacterium capitovis]
MNRYAAAALILVAGAALSACSPSDEASISTSASTSTVPVTVPVTATSTALTTADADAPAVVLDNGTVRAKGADGMDMTAIFGTLRNTTDKDITITGFTTSLGQARYELHETVDGTMREMEGGLVIPAYGTYELAPGGSHLMVLDYPAEIAAGDTVTLTLHAADGSDIVIPDVAVRTLIPGYEDYADHSSASESSGAEATHVH